MSLRIDKKLDLGDNATRLSNCLEDEDKYASASIAGNPQSLQFVSWEIPSSAATKAPARSGNLGQPSRPTPSLISQKVIHTRDTAPAPRTTTTSIFFLVSLPMNFLLREFVNCVFLIYNLLLNADYRDACHKSLTQNDAR